MNTVIFKYPLDLTSPNIMGMPVGAEILTVQIQRGDICLWAKVDPDAELEDRQFVVYGTGHTIKAGNDSYIGTVQMAHGALVWHVFETGEQK